MNLKSSHTPIIGIEIHVELCTKSKMFCGCPAEHFSIKPNTHTCPVCLGLPGALPVPNKKAIKWTIMVGQALNCQINNHSKFDRKHYFYPDLAKGYQISQYDEPLCGEGFVAFGDKKISIERIHLEEDTGKLKHATLPLPKWQQLSEDRKRGSSPRKVSLVDFNRSGVPLVEIVSKPDIHSSKEAKKYAQTIRNTVQFLSVSNGDLEKGSMRLEANISWGLDLGYKVEVKNINSFKYLEKAIDYELSRQKKLLDQGITPDQETRGWNERKAETFPQRSKETAKDYRYFPEPDIPPIHFTDQQVASIRTSMPMLPKEYFDSFIESGIREDYATTLTQHRKLAAKAGECIELGKKEIMPQEIAKWLVNKKTQTKNLSAKEIMKLITQESQKPQSSQEDLIRLVQESIQDNPDLVQKYKSGKKAVLGAFIGDVMKRSRGKSDPHATKEYLIIKLSD